MGMTINIASDNSGAVIDAKDAAVRRAMEAIGIHLEGEAADELENSPRRVDTGRLKGSMAHSSDDRSVTVGTNVEYAIYVHFGTRKMDANAFLKNAFEHNMDQIREYIINELRG